MADCVRKASTGRALGMIVVLIGLIPADAARGAGQKPLDVAKVPGREFVARIHFSDATIEAQETGRIRYRVAGEKKSRAARQDDVRVFREESVAERPLEFLPEPSFDPGERVRLGHFGRWTYVMRRGGEKAQLRIDDTARNAAAPNGPTHIPTPDEVKDVLKLDAPDRKEKFGRLDEETRRDLLVTAGNISGLRNVPPIGSIKPLKQHIDLFDKQRIRDWLVGIADAAGVDRLIEALGTPPAKRDVVKMAYAGLSSDERRAMIDLARKIRASGMRSLTQAEQQIVRQNRLIFGGK